MPSRLPRVSTSMPTIAITREVSPSLNACELSFHGRQAIDVAKARAEHAAYRECLAELGARVIALPAEPALPDAVFVEDPVVVLDEVAIISNMGAATRRPEAASLAEALRPYRALEFLQPPGTLDGGDVMRIGRTLFVGASGRTNRAGIEQLRDLLEPRGYRVEAVAVTGCLHLKSACSYIESNTILLNRGWIDAERLAGFDLLDVADEEPAAANALCLNGRVILPTAFPRTRALLEGRGFAVRPVDVAELQKAEAGVTCCSVIFEAN